MEPAALNYDPVIDAQQIFRMILDCMAHPGKILPLKVAFEWSSGYGVNPASLFVGLALLNRDVSFFSDASIALKLKSETNAMQEAPATADFIFITGNPETIAVVEAAKTGSLSYPEESATLVIAVEELLESEEALQLYNGQQLTRLTLKGPGIRTEQQVAVIGVDPKLLLVIRKKNSEFPLGIDLIFTDKKNRIMCIPRSTRFILIPAL